MPIIVIEGDPTVRNLLERICEVVLAPLVLVVVLAALGLIAAWVGMRSLGLAAGESWRSLRKRLDSVLR